MRELLQEPYNFNSLEVSWVQREAMHTLIYEDLLQCSYSLRERETKQEAKQKAELSAHLRSLI